jgi:hypothetical protein
MVKFITAIESKERILKIVNGTKKVILGYFKFWILFVVSCAFSNADLEA